jgi:hypothetical protein
VIPASCSAGRPATWATQDGPTAYVQYTGDRRCN